MEGRSDFSAAFTHPRSSLGKCLRLSPSALKSQKQQISEFLILCTDLVGTCMKSTCSFEQEEHFGLYNSALRSESRISGVAPYHPLSVCRQNAGNSMAKWHIYDEETVEGRGK